MDFPIHIDGISMGMSILYFKRLHVKVLNQDAFLSLKITFILTNSAETDEMPYAVFHWIFTVCQSNCLAVSRWKMVNEL